MSRGIEMWLENNRFVELAPVARERIATAGERVVLERVLWTGECPVEREHLRLTEVDGEGRSRASIRFDPDDRAAAFEEAYARFVAGEAAGDEAQAAIASIFRGFNQRDWTVWQRCRWNRHDGVFESRAFGTYEGGPFEQSTALTVALVEPRNSHARGRC